MERTFAQEWTELVRNAAMRGAVARSMPQRCFRPELLLKLAQAPPGGLSVGEATEQTRGHQGNVSRALATWDKLGLVTWQDEGDPRELRRASKRFYRLTHRGRELAELLESER